MDAKREQAERIITERQAVGWYRHEHLDLPHMTDAQVYTFMNRVNFYWNKTGQVWLEQHTLLETTERR